MVNTRDSRDASTSGSMTNRVRVDMSKRTCSVEACVNVAWARGYCSKHYQAWRAHGSPTGTAGRTRTYCTIDGCARPTHGRGLCQLHYLRWRDHGDAEHERTVITACRVDECTNTPRSQSTDLCEKHYYRIRRHGDALAVLDTKHSDAKYRAAHARIARARGKARTYPCVDCGGRAHHWSYTHSDPDQLISDTGQPYSLDPGHYEPRCAPCHTRYDGTSANQYTHRTA